IQDVPGGQTPGIEDGLLVRVIGMDGRHHSAWRVVAEDRADTDPRAEFELLPGGGKLAEERLILPYRLALVVIDRPAGSDPPEFLWFLVDDAAGFGLLLLLDLPAETVGIAEADLQFALAAARRAAVRLPGDGGGEWGPPRGRVVRCGQRRVVEAVDVVDHPRRRVAEQGRRGRVRVGGVVQPVD